jgi:choice-of-anchor B domain-containing protein
MSAALFASAQNVNNVFRSKMTFPGQTLANVWGYAAGGKEYALLGAAKGLIIVDITNPDQPKQIVQIPGPNNLWKEIKTYKNFAYIVSEGGMGVQIVNLSNLPSPNLASKFYQGDGAILNQLTTIHALHIDTTKGFLYAWGGSLFGGAAKIFNLNPDPYNPTYAGKYDQLGYIHDGFVDNDTMYAGHIYAGYFSIVNMTDKANPELLNTQNTPDNFTHNTWLSDDRHTLFTTDERNNSFLAAYDVSNPDDIKFLDKIQSNPGSNSIVHNTYYKKGFAVSSWYKDGYTIMDAFRPDNLIQVGNYDTYPGAGGGFEGCWGVYPYLPSGTIIASNIEASGTSDGEAFFVSPKYVRACYFEGLVTDAGTGLPINGAQVNVLSSSILLNSDQSGVFKGGQLTPGVFTVEVTKSGYQPYITQVQLENGILTELKVELYPFGNLVVNGKVVRHADQSPVAGAKVWLYGVNDAVEQTSDAQGNFSFNAVLPGEYSIAASEISAGMVILNKQKLVQPATYQLELYPNYRRGASAGRKALTPLLYPNPFTDHLSFKADFWLDNTQIRVYNVLGELVFQQVLCAGNTLELGAGWSPGVYTVQVLDGAELLEAVRLVKAGY